MMSILKQKKYILFIIVVAIASFIFWNYPVFSYQNLQSDSNYYDRVAMNFVQGNGFTDGGEHQTYTIGYETFLATIYTFFGHQVNAVRGVQGVLFVCIVLLMFHLGKRFLGERIGLGAALFGALFYILPISAGVIGKENLTTFLILMFFFFFMSWRDTRSIRDMLFAGFFLGALALTAGITKFLFVPIFLLLVVTERKTLASKQTLAALVFFILAYAATVSPYFYLSARYESSLGLTSSGGGLYTRTELIENLWPDYPAHLIGMSFGYYFSEKLYPDVNPRAFRDVPKTEQVIQELKDAGYPEYEWQHILFKRGLDEIMHNPHKYLLISLLDFISFNSPLVPHGHYRDLNFIHLTFAEGRYAELPAVIKAGYLLTVRGLWDAFLISAFYGMVLLWKKDRTVLIFLLLFILYFNALYGLVHAIPRYAIPLYPLYIMFAFAGLASLISHTYVKPNHTHSSIQ